MKTETIDALNGLIADYTVLYQKSRAYHWMVEGPSFFPLHEAFEKAYEECAKTIDELAERIRAVHGRPVLTLKQALADSAVSEDEGTPDAEEMVRRLESDFVETLQAATKAADGADRATASLLDEIALRQEKLAWMLRAFLGQVEAAVSQRRS